MNDIGGATGREMTIDAVETATDLSLTDTEGSDSPPSKRAAVEHASALAGLTLQLVMQFAGSDEGIFIANVCRSWSNSYKSTFNDEITTHRAAGMMSLNRMYWIWSDSHHALPNESFVCGRHRRTRDFDWYVGKYAPRAIVEATILDESLAISSEHLMRGVAASGRLKLFEDLWKDHVTAEVNGVQLGFRMGQLACEAASYGHGHILASVWSSLAGKAELLVSYCGDLSAEAAARDGYTHVLEFLSRSSWWAGDFGHSNVNRMAIVFNQMSVLRWLPAHGEDFDERDALTAAVHADISTINFLFENGCPGMNRDFVACCVQYERLDALQWCYDTLRIREPNLWTESNLQHWMLLAGTCDKKLPAKFVLEHGALWPNIGQEFGEYINGFEESGEYIYEEESIRCIWSPSFMEWAMAEGCTFDTWTMATCARILEFADWDNTSGCPLLKTLAWAHARACPCTCPRHVPDF